MGTLVDRRAFLALLLALVPVVATLAIGAVWLDRTSNDITSIDRDRELIATASTYASNRNSLSTAVHVIQAAALPGGDVAFGEAARAMTASLALRESRSAQGSALVAPVGGLQATEADTERVPDIVIGLLGAQTIGEPPSQALERAESNVTAALVDGSIPALLIQVGAADTELNRLRNLLDLDADLDADLRATLRGLLDGEMIDSGDLRSLLPVRPVRWDASANDWVLGGEVDVTRLFPTESAAPAAPPQEAGRLDVDPIEVGFTNLVAAVNVEQRLAAIGDLLAVDQDLAASIELAEADTLVALSEHREDLVRTRALVAVLWLGLLGLGVALLVISRQESVRRMNVEAAHASALDEMERKAYRDPLTGLFNRRWLDEHLAADLAQLQQSRCVTLLYLDLDSFKSVNDVWGHDAGDEVLRSVGAALLQKSLADWSFARFGGDEFVGIAVGDLPATRREVAAVMQSVSGLTIHGLPHRQTLTITASAGVAVASAGTTPAEALLQADAALGQSKLQRRGSFSFYDATTSRTGELLPILPRAFEREEFTIALQPIYDIATGQPVEFEALARWHRDDGSISPGEFVPLVETYGLSDQLTQAVLARVREARELRPELPRTWINVSPGELARVDSASHLLTNIRAAGLMPTDIGIELTERAAVDNFNAVAASIEHLQAAGTDVAIDDFGSGYSPLGYLRTLDVDVIKLDRELISGIEADAVNQEIVTGIVRTASELGTAIIAEGVERREELEWLRAAGISLVQGFYLGRPADVASAAFDQLDLGAPDVSIVDDDARRSVPSAG